MLSSVFRRPLLRAPASALSYQTTRNATVSAVAHDLQQFNRVHHDNLQRDEFWRKVPAYENVAAADFLSYRWSVSTSQASCMSAHKLTGLLVFTWTSLFL